MSNVFLSYNNIISSLGFDSETVADRIQNGISGLQLIKDKSILPESFYSSIIDTSKLESAFSEICSKGEYTRLEKMMITSLHSIIIKSNIELTDRVGLIISTTKGNIDTLDSNSTFPKERAYLNELGTTIKGFFNFKNDAIIVSNACVSGILSVAIAKRFINQGIYDHVFVVGGDLITEFIMSGFNSFQALSNLPCKPYDKNRKGINIGEVAASALVTSNESYLAKESVEILGEGSCNDANHISGPSRTGEGLFRSIGSALDQANMNYNDIDYISAHGTATLFNDDMEAIAFNRQKLQMCH